MKIHRLSILAAGLVWALGATAQAKAPKGKTQLVLQVKPVTALVFVDSKPKGKATSGRTIDVTPGFHVVKLTSNGDEHEERIKFASGKPTTYSYEFDEPQPAAQQPPDDSQVQLPDPSSQP
ncbi:MAG: hypothetical protein ACYCWW_19065 [Deltaproteobacteria bacterium]